MLFTLAQVTVTQTSSSTYVNYPAFAVIFAIGMAIGFLIGRLRGHPILGAVLGIFGLIGWIIAAVLPRSADAQARHDAKVAHRHSHAEVRAA